MTKIQLIGATHSGCADANGKRTILDRKSDDSFFKIYGDQIDTKTLIISEGYFDTMVTTPGHAHYEERLMHVSPLLSKQGIQPDLLFPDRRYNLPEKDLSTYGQQLLSLQQLGGQKLNEMSFKKPNSMEELIDTVINDGWEFSLDMEVPPIFCGAMLAFTIVEDIVDKSFSESVLIHQNEYEKIFVILGNVHALSIAKVTRWDLDIMDTYLGFTGIFKTTLSYIFLRELPKLLSKK